MCRLAVTPEKKCMLPRALGFRPETSNYLNLSEPYRAGDIRKMAGPDFSKTTADVLARRARFQCSNPDCGAQTIGPNTDPEKATTIGEAAHIYGAQPGAKRYDAKMSDATRSAITNGIWLCRNCHGHIDRDADKYPADLLLVWRIKHEERVLRELGTRGEHIRHEVEMAKFHFLNGYPQIIQRIVLDKPEGWEWRLAAELLRYLNSPQVKRYQNLVTGHYYRSYPRVRSDEFIGWAHERTNVMAKLVDPLVKLFERLTTAFGAPGESGDVEQLHEVCVLIRDMLAECVDHEEALRFTLVPEEGEELRSILVDAVGRNLLKLVDLPSKLDEMVAMIGGDHGGTAENPHVMTWTVTFDIPDDFVERFNVALARYQQLLEMD